MVSSTKPRNIRSGPNVIQEKKSRIPSVFAIAVAVQLIAAFTSCGDQPCTLIGCRDGMELRIVGELPDTFTVTAEGVWPAALVGRVIAEPQRVVIGCMRGEEAGCYWGGDMGTAFVHLPIIAPVLNIRLSAGDRESVHVLRPEWRKLEFNGPGCGVCWGGGVDTLRVQLM